MVCGPRGVAVPCSVPKGAFLPHFPAITGERRARCVAGSAAAVSGAAHGPRGSGRERGPPRFPSLISGNFFRPQDIQHTEEFFIKPESRIAQLDTSQWPLLLKVGRVIDNLAARPCPCSFFCPRSVQARGDAQLLLCVTLPLRNSMRDTQQRQTLCMQKSC